MKLSIIIVSYNVKALLEQCLHSVQKAISYAGIDTEIIVVDNNSADSTVTELRIIFPLVKFIVNKENTGFGKACNQGYANAAGAYILFLNPDTIIPEDCFTKCIDFMTSKPEAGVLGVRMVDENGNFLKESKRGFPSPSASLYKLCGLAALFSTSKTFARYYMGHLPENEMNEVDILSGAFMLIKKDALERTGGFDETFFMYGEDIDLSYRIQKAGYKNYYFPVVTITHYKGKSTNKESASYIKNFYGAMYIFAKKHITNKANPVITLLLRLGIFLASSFASVKLLFRRNK